MYKILIADDEHNIRHILDFSLHAEGFDVVSAPTGDEALKLAIDEPPDLVILDVMMPGLGGIETCRCLKQNSRTAHVPVVMLTACNSREGRAEAEAAGADMYVTKPFSPQKIVDLVQHLLGVVSE